MIKNEVKEAQHCVYQHQRLTFLMKENIHLKWIFRGSFYISFPNKQHLKSLEIDYNEIYQRFDNTERFFSGEFLSLSVAFLARAKSVNFWPWFRLNTMIHVRNYKIRDCYFGERWCSYPCLWWVWALGEVYQAKADCSGTLWFCEVFGGTCVFYGGYSWSERWCEFSCGRMYGRTSRSEDKGTAEHLKKGTYKSSHFFQKRMCTFTPSPVFTFWSGSCWRSVSFALFV